MNLLRRLRETLAFVSKSVRVNIEQCDTKHITHEQANRRPTAQIRYLDKRHDKHREHGHGKTEQVEQRQGNKRLLSVKYVARIRRHVNGKCGQRNLKLHQLTNDKINPTFIETNDKHGKTHTQINRQNRKATPTSTAARKMLLT